jgi:hypothetical protein
MSAEMTPQEYEAIHDEVWRDWWSDPGRMNNLVTISLAALSEIAMDDHDPDSAEHVATQALRRMVQRCVTGDLHPDVWIP